MWDGIPESQMVQDYTDSMDMFSSYPTDFFYPFFFLITEL